MSGREDSDFKEVTREEFFAQIGPMNVNPRCADPAYTDWETPSRALIGRSYPGWKNPGDAKRYLLRRQP